LETPEEKLAPTSSTLTVQGPGTVVAWGVGLEVGEPVGEAVGDLVGDPVGVSVGTWVGVEVGEPVGGAVGVSVGTWVGVEVGEPVGGAVVGQLSPQQQILWKLPPDESHVVGALLLT